MTVLFTPSTPNRQNRNQVHWNICAGVRRSTPSSKVVQTEQSRDLFQKRWRIIACMCGTILYRLIYSGILQSAQFYLFMWLFWLTQSTLKIAKSSTPQISRISPFASWVTSDIWLVSFKSRKQWSHNIFLIKMAARSQCAPSERWQVCSC